MWTYVQLDGDFSHEGQHVGFGYAGRGEGKNNPVMQSVKGIGPLPVGVYRAEAPEDHPTVGRYAIHLIPDPANEMYGRASFFMHGDSSEHPGLASHGCIVLARAFRAQFWNSGDHMIRVVSGV